MIEKKLKQPSSNAFLKSAISPEFPSRFSLPLFCTRVSGRRIHGKSFASKKDKLENGAIGSGVVFRD